MTDSRAALSDAVLLARCRREPAAFCIVYDRHAAGLLGLVMGQCDDREVALEIVQETFARALRDARRFKNRGDGSALPWLRTIALNLVRDWRRRGVVEDRVRRQLGIALVTEADPQARIEERLDAISARTQISAALAQLPGKQRAAVEARVLLGAGYEEIAQVEGISNQTARARVSRGLSRLRVLLGSSQGDKR